MSSDLYNKLVVYYESVYFSGKHKLEKDLQRIMSEKKCSREEAVKILYREVFGEETRKEQKPRDLEEALAELKEAKKSYSSFVKMSFLVLFVFFALSALSFNFGAALVVWFIALITIVIMGIISKTRTIEWNYSEIMILDVEILDLKEYAERTIVKFQQETLEACKYSLKENSLTVTVTPTTIISKVVTDQYGSRQVSEEVDLGTLTIKADFEKEQGVTKVRLTYSAEVKVEYADYAAAAYEKIIVGFKTALKETAFEMKPKKVVVIDFAKILEKLKKSGVILKAVKCPVCGAPVKLPEKGDTVKCPYCGSTLKAIDVYKLLSKILNI